MPSNGQLGLVIASIALFTLGGLLSLLRWGRSGESLRIAAKACVYLGVSVSIGVLIWHSIDRGNWLPLGDNFNALISLGVLLSLFVLYVQWHKPLAGLDWFVMPIVVLLLIGAAVFGRAKPHAYIESTWAWVHVVTTLGGAMVFAIAGVAGIMYLISLRRIRTKSALTGPDIGGSLERLERLLTTSVTLGFALLTVGMIMGVAELARGARVPMPKLVLASCVWVVYAIVLHAPINPSFRGRKAAVLSVVGLGLMACTIIVVMLTAPGGGGTR